MKVEWIEWEDSRTVTPEWFDKSQCPDEELMLLESVGFVAHENDSRVILVTSHDPHMDKFASGMIIPKSAIRKRKVLRR